MRSSCRNFRCLTWKSTKGKYGDLRIKKIRKSRLRRYFWISFRKFTRSLSNRRSHCFKLKRTKLAGFSIGRFIWVKIFKNHLVITISSIFKIILTHSVAKVKADRETSNGWTTFCSSMSSILFLLMLRPSYLYPWMCLLRSSVTKVIGSNPAFSARV